MPLSPWPPLEGVCIFPCRQLVLYDVILLLLLDIFLNRGFIEANGAYIVPLRPKFSVAKLVFQVRVLIKNHQGTLAFQIPHKTRHADFGWDTHKHMQHGLA